MPIYRTWRETGAGIVERLGLVAVGLEAWFRPPPPLSAVEWIATIERSPVASVREEADPLVSIEFARLPEIHQLAHRLRCASSRLVKY